MGTSIATKQLLPGAALKPRLRGVSHQYAFFVSLACGAGLILAASGGRARLAASVYAAAVSALFGTSALYHRVTWRPGARRWMRRLDHSMIFVLIAGAVIYASERPNPWPRVFGYHEVFHALVIAAAALHYAVIAFAVLPRG